MANAPTPPKPPKVKPYITIIESRAPRQKAHTSRGHAINALKYCAREGTMWREVDGEWKLAATAVVTVSKHPHYGWLDRKVDLKWEEGEQP